MHPRLYLILFLQDVPSSAAREGVMKEVRSAFTPGTFPIF